PGPTRSLEAVSKKGTFQRGGQAPRRLGASPLFETVSYVLGDVPSLLLSMTGFGDARFQDQRWSIHVEVRTVNNRHLKVASKISEPYTSLESEIEHLIRERLRRGAVQITVRIERPRRAEDYRLNTVALASYREQVEQLRGPGQAPVDLGSLLALPGVVE